MSGIEFSWVLPWALPLGLALTSWAGFALGVLPFRVRSSHDHHGGEGLAKEVETSVLDYLHPVTVAFFIGYVGFALLPDAAATTGPGLPAFAAGALLMAVLSRKILKRDPCCETGHDHDPLGWPFFLALTVCAVNDGLLIGLIAPSWFSGLNFGMIVHKITSSFALALALGHWRYSGRRLLVLGLINGLISPVFFYAGGFLRGGEFAPMQVLMGFSTGVLVYTVLTGMLPHSWQLLRRRPTAWIGFLGALAVAVCLGFLHHEFH